MTTGNEHEGPEVDESGGAASGGEAFGARTPGFEHLQAAAAEMIAAARALLDVAEELVADPRTAGTIAAAVSSLGKAATRAAATGRRTVHGEDEPDPGDDGDNGGGVQRIPVS